MTKIVDALSEKLETFLDKNVSKEDFSLRWLYLFRRITSLNSGTAIGIKFTSPHAYIFMGKVEKELLDKELLKPWIWHLFVWTHGEESLQKFLEHLNNFQKCPEISVYQVNFLDIIVK